MFGRVVIACIGILILIFLAKSIHNTSREAPEYSDSVPFKEVIPFKYNNHYYIEFVNYGNYTPFGIIHDPNCPCYAKRN